MGNLPFERTRYNPVQETTGEEAERNKQQMNQAEAAREQDQTQGGGRDPGDETTEKPKPGNAQTGNTPGSTGQTGNAQSGGGTP
ncbi:hypothetical protein KTN05_04035 [Paracoccus sp. Z118]|uniref:hypothetical protein n=1 Tax=Paracoccus sp. Z118 TaxID=2851017 RepID=UPI001C2C8076|nr:hypothetical protein [Paracoccus sp. Z118]MBV0891018.1 hypothetical protein [Paracoccus sp. Z118]